MALILLRHTQPDIAPGICYGRSDIGLPDSFPADAESVLATLPEFDRIVSSPLTRCHRLAEFVAGHHGMEISVETRLQEMDFGKWERCPWSDIPRKELDAWANNFFHARPHGGESVAMLKARSLEALAELNHDNEATLVVTHAGVIKMALAKSPAASDHNQTINYGCFEILTDVRTPE